MILGFVALLLIFLPMKEQKNGFKHSRITYINELALTVGLIMLTIGFLEVNGLMKVGDVTGDGIKRNLGIN
jgi:hypothetical protein